MIHSKQDYEPVFGSIVVYIVEYLLKYFQKIPLSLKGIWVKHGLSIMWNRASYYFFLIFESLP